MENSEASAAAVRDVLRGRGEESSGSCETVAKAEEELQPLDTANGNYASSSALEENRASLAQAWRLGTPARKKLLILDLNGILVACHKKLDRSIGGDELCIQAAVLHRLHRFLLREFPRRRVVFQDGGQRAQDP